MWDWCTCLVDHDVGVWGSTDTLGLCDVCNNIDNHGVPCNHVHHLDDVSSILENMCIPITTTTVLICAPCDLILWKLRRGISHNCELLWWGKRHLLIGICGCVLGLLHKVGHATE